MNEYIIQFEHSIPFPLCTDIINLFEKQEDKYIGCTLGGVNTKIKDTTDYNIPKNNEIWNKIEKYLYKELSEKIILYQKKINNKDGYNNNYDNKFSHFFDSKLFTHNFMIQKYTKKTGKYVYHNDFDINFEYKSYRVITFLWYLNTIDDGGETEFFGGDFKIKPECGKLVLFPAAWSFPHSGKMPISDNKYIITGWLYIK